MMTWWLLACTHGKDTAAPVDSAPPEAQDTAAPMECASISVDADALSFSAPVGGAEVQSLHLQNLCKVEVDVAAQIDGDDAFQVAAVTLTLGGGQGAVLQVSYAPESYEVHGGVLLLKTLDGQHTLQLAGQPMSDGDGDGFDAEAMGGEDCDDTDPDVNPEAEEQPYDELDSDCDGDRGDDVDGDGYDGDAVGGEDCDDEDPGISPAAPESRNAEDDDCDGLADEGFVAPGDVFPSELLVDPDATSDADGQWIELYNASSADVNVVGWIFENANGDGAQVARATVVPAGGYALLAANPDVDANGGVSASYGYGYTNLPLSTASDELSAWAGGDQMFSLRYGDGWPLYAGRSIQLNPADLELDKIGDPAWWCYAEERWENNGDRGTPGVTNDPCGSLDQDGDGVSADDGDCDEGDPSVFPGASERWDGVDQDCDDVVDELAVDSADGAVTGDGSDLLGFDHALVVGDLAGDGVLDVLVGALEAGDAGAVWLLAGDDVAAGGALDDLAVTSMDGDASDGQTDFASLPGRLGDHDDDGADDLVVAGGGSGAVAAVFTGRPVWTDLDDAAVTMSFDGASANAASVAVGDLDGDGVDDVAWGSALTSDSQYYEGVVAVWLADGSTDVALESDAALLAFGDESFDYVGSALGSGDLDDDGYDELFVGARGDDDGGSAAGAVFVVPGSASFAGTGSLEDLASAKVVGSRANAELGRSEAAQVADLDGDTLPDLVVGAHGDGEVWVFASAGSASGTLEAGDADAVVGGASAGHFGFSVSTGEIDGDGNADLLLTAPDVEDGDLGAATKPGEAWLLSGGAVATGSISDLASATVTADAASSGLGHASALSDLDGDGRDDVLLSASGAGLLLLWSSP